MADSGGFSGQRAAHGPRRRAAARDVALLGLAVALMALAVGLFTCLSADGAAPDDEYIGFHCPACDHTFRISHRDFERRYDDNEVRWDDDGRLCIRCEECGEFTARRGAGK